MTRVRRKSSLVTLGVLVVAAIAWAYWTTTGTGSGEAAVGDLTAPELSVPGTSSGSHALAWTAATTGDPSLDSEIIYNVERKLEAGGSYAPVAMGSCSGDLLSTTMGCTDTVTASGNYFYRVIASVRSWTAMSNEAGPVVATVGPADETPPNVTAIDRADDDPTNAASVSWTVTFDENVNNVDSTDFDLVEGGNVSGSSITNVTPASGPDDTYTVTADTGSGSGTLRLDLDDDDSIEDGAGNKLGGTGTGGAEDGSFTGQQYTIDKTPPEVDSIVRYDPTSSLTNASAVTWEVTFTENVTNVNLGDFVLAEGTGLTGSTPANVVQVNGSTYRVEANTGSGDGNLNLNVDDDDSIADGVGNKLGGTGTSGAGDGSFNGGAAAEYHIDKTGPSVQSITRNDANPTNAGTVSWTVTFDDSSVQGVDDTGPNEGDDFELVGTGLGGTPAITDVHAESGSTYTVTASTGTGSGTLQLNLDDDDSITDQLGNPLGGVGTSGAGDGSFEGVAAVYTIDRTAPTVQSINRADASPTNAGSVSWTVTFSENVSGVNAADFDPVPSGLGGSPAVTGVAPVNGSTYTVTASTGTGSGTLGLDLDDDDSIQDTATNKLGGTGADNGDFTGQVYTIDKTAPQLVSLEMRDNDTDGLVDRVVATFDETLANSTDDGPWTLANVPSGGTKGTVSTSGAVATLLINEGAGAKDTAVGSFTVALAQSATGIRDSLGNQSSFAAQSPSDKASPVVSSINRSGSSPTNAASVDFAVTFSESVTGVNAADFSVPTTGSVTGASISSVSGSGASYTVSVNTGSDSGTVGLNLVDDDSIEDSSNNKLGGAGNANGNFTGQTYTIDKTPPTVQSISRAGASPTNANSVSWTVTFSENVSPVIADDFELVATGLTGTSITDVTGSNATYTVTASTGSGNGTLGLNLNDANNSIQDSVGNAIVANTFTGDEYTVDKTAPTLSTLEMFDTEATPDGMVDQVKATFNEALASSTATAPWTLANAPGGGGNTLNSVSTSGSVATLTLNEGTVNTANGTYTGTTLNQFTVALAASAAGIRDAAGNQASFSATNVVDKAKPIPTTLTPNRASPNNDPDSNDKWSVVFSEPLKVSSMCDPTWSGNTSNQALQTDGDVTMKIKDNAAANGNDQLVISAIGNSKCATSFSFGELDMGSAGYVATDQTSSGTGSNRSEITWTFSTRTLLFELGTITAASQTGTRTIVWSATSGMQDISGNAVTGTASNTGSQNF